MEVVQDGFVIFMVERYSDSVSPDAMQIRNTRAKELRKQGFNVVCKKYDFTDLARSCAYVLEATLPGWEFHSMGGWRRI